VECLQSCGNKIKALAMLSCGIASAVKRGGEVQEGGHECFHNNSSSAKILVKHYYIRRLHISLHGRFELA
jgi:hypothetical protein